MLDSRLIESCSKGIFLIKIVERPLTVEQDSIPGYLAYPERNA